jgi:hypothetical protein
MTGSDVIIVVCFVGVCVVSLGVAVGDAACGGNCGGNGTNLDYNTEFFLIKQKL